MDFDFKSLKHSIIRKLISYVFLFYIIIALTATFFQMYSSYREAQQRIKNEWHFCVSMEMASLTEALRSSNSHVLQKILEGFSKGDSILGVQIADMKQRTWSAGFIPEGAEGGALTHFDESSGKKLAEQQAFYGLFSHEEDMTDGMNPQNKIGTITFYSSFHAVFRQVQHSFAIIIFNAMIKTASLGALLIVFGYRFLTKPLTALTAAAKEVRLGNLEIELLSEPTTWPTEVDILNEGMDSMVSRLRFAKKNSVKSEHCVRNIIDAMPSLVIGVSEEGIICDWNTAMEKISGIPTDTAVGQKLFEFYPPYFFLREAVEKSLTQYSVERLSNQVVYINNTRIYQDIIVYPTTNENHTWLIIRIDDVTARVNLERVMVQTEKMSSVGELAAGMAHEISTPLGAILQGSQNIMRRLDPELEANQKVAQELGLDLMLLKQYFEKRKLDTFIDGIRVAAETASASVENLLKFSKNSNVSKEACALDALIKDSITLAKTDYELKKTANLERFQLEILGTEGLPMIYVSKVEIEQVLLTIIKYMAHAMKFQDNQPIITFKLAVIDNMVQLEMIDNGPGTSLEVQEKIFDPFFTTKSLGETTGLGLSVAYKIVTEGHQGTLKIASDGTHGNTFTIRLPLATTS